MIDFNIYFGGSLVTTTCTFVHRVLFLVVKGELCALFANQTFVRTKRPVDRMHLLLCKQGVPVAILNRVSSKQELWVLNSVQIGSTIAFTTHVRFDCLWNRLLSFVQYIHQLPSKAFVVICKESV